MPGAESVPEGVPDGDPEGVAAGVPDGAVLADPGQRLLARIADTLIVALPVVLVLRETVAYRTLEWLAPPLVAVLLFVYEAPQLALWGRTPGKRFAGVRVVREDGHEPLGAARAVLRAAVYDLPIAARPVPVLGLLAGIFWVANGAFVYEGSRGALPDGRRQALHDRLARTLVVKEPAGESGAAGGADPAAG
ncbi:RDD family protein [Actinomadura parmotrematis]|uniref:RDD family protein n=1 Tax=Actinomadura parmotrematis TaxID=2864039 RepID=A0ABS7FZE0_9ACTN|nr:RDD family protein [Actinomadura parmotrematis]MBW8484989.1 RDD family protein [Actinomadura parmotrematis]